MKMYVPYTNSCEYTHRIECESCHYDIKYGKEDGHYHKKRFISWPEAWIRYYNGYYSQNPPIEPNARAEYLSHQGESSLDARSSFGRCIHDPIFSA